MNRHVPRSIALPALLCAGLITANGLFSIALADDQPPFDLGGTVTVTRVIDGDSLRSGDLRIRVHGIDAPEMRQSCVDGRGASWACGKAARTAMTEIVSNAPNLQCDLLDVDRYGRLVMRCMAGDTDIAAALVRRGLALAYRRHASDYIAAEQAAEKAGAGMWQGKFDPPWEWRKAN